MTWIDHNGEVRPQSWEEYCEMKEQVPGWALPLRRIYQPLRVKGPNRSNDRENVARMRKRLFAADQHCFWCGRLTKLGVVNDPLQATVDHLYSRLHPQRADRYREQKGVLHVLSCAACNNERGVCEQQGRQFIPKLKERLEHAQLADATLAKKTVQTIEPVRPPMRVICTLEEAVTFAKENPAR